MTNEKPFDPPVDVSLPSGSRSVGSAQEALALLTRTDWPGERGDLHADAVETCLKVIDGHRSTIDARDRFCEAAREAGLMGDRVSDS